MAEREVDPNQLKRLTEIFRQLGASDPEGWAGSELREGINQLAYFVFLKQAWASIEDEKETSWIDKYIAWGKSKSDPATYKEGNWGKISAALERMLARGISREEIAGFVQMMQYMVLNDLCALLDDGGFASPINAPADWPRVRWKLFQVDENGKPLKAMGALHEYADSGDPTGRESGFRS